MGELGDAGHEDEAEIRVAGLEGAVEVSHDVAEYRQGRILVDYVQQGCVVFVDEHDYFLPGLPICGLYQIFQPEIGVFVFGNSLSCHESWLPKAASSCSFSMCFAMLMSKCSTGYVVQFFSKAYMASP